MSHLQTYTVNSQNLINVVKTLKFLGFKKFSLEQTKFENFLFSIQLISFKFNNLFSFCWNGNGYNLTTDPNLDFKVEKLKYYFFKLSTIQILTQQSKNLGFQFCYFQELDKINKIKISINRCTY